jgi:lysozyme
MTRRAINKDGLELVKAFEGCKLTSYLCPAKVWTIGYGSTGPHVKPGMTITKDQAEELLRSDLRRFEDYVAKECAPATDNQYSALVSFCFNVGETALKGSTLRRMHLEGNYEGAAGQFARWNKGGGKVLPGLVRRREAEAALYRKP